MHEVIAAIATAPWSISNSVPSASVTVAGLLGRPPSPARPRVRRAAGCRRRCRRGDGRVGGREGLGDRLVVARSASPVASST